MTDRTSESPELERVKSRQVKVDFSGGTLTSDGGLLLLREVDKRLDLVDRLAAIIPDPRNPLCTLHTQAEILRSRIFGIAAGYEDANDHEQLRHDPAFQVAAGRTPAEHQYDGGLYPLASPSTHSRFKNRVSRIDNFRLHELMVDIFLESFDKAPKELTLDFDATDDRTHGEQQKVFFHAYYDSYCFLPLYVFCGDQILVSYLRASNRDAAYHSCAITKLLVEKIHARWPDTKIIIRGDGGFARFRLMRWCERNDVYYVFGLPKNSVLTSKIADEMAEAKAEFEDTGEKQLRFRWFRYRTHKTWKRHRWVVGKAEHSDKGANPRFVVTNLPTSEGIEDEVWYHPNVDGKRKRVLKSPGVECSPVECPKTFYQTTYCQRGEMENRIKEQQLCLFADRTSCTKFEANQFRLLMSSFAYILVDGIRRLALKDTEHARLRVDTIRLRLFKIAARVRVTHRRIVFQLPSHCPAEKLFKHVLRRLCLSG